MRIMHVITGLETGGAEMMLFKLLSAAPGDWNPLVVSVRDQGSLGPRLLELGIPVHSLNFRRTSPNLLHALSIAPLARRFRPRLIQGWMYHGNLAASFARTCLSQRIPVLWNIRQSLYDLDAERRMTAMVIRMGAWLSRHVSSIVYNSQTSALHHEALGYQAGRRVVIPNGFDCEVFHPDEDGRRQCRARLDIDADSILIGLMARYHPMKDHENFLRAAGMIARTRPHARFLLAGKGVTKDQPALAKILGEEELRDRVLMLGEQSDMSGLTAALDIACSASWSEGFSNSIGEAMACAVPCVVTDVGDSATLVADTGLCVPPRNPAALARGIGRLIDAGPDGRRALGAAARRRIEIEYSLPGIVRQYVDLYQRHIDGAPQP